MNTLLFWCILVPLLGAILIAVNHKRPNLREAATLLTASALFALVLRIYPQVSAGGRPSAVLFEILPGLDVALEVEPLGMIFALLASFLWIVTSIYSIGYMRGHNEPHQTRFYVCFAIALSSAIGVAFSANMLTLFIFYEVLTISTYPLVTHSGTDEAKRAGRVYLGMLIATSIGLQLVAIVATYMLAGTLDFELGGVLRDKASPLLMGVLFALYVFGVGKAALMPFHRWLPAAMVAPTPVSALLHAVAVVKTGVFTVLKVTVYIFGTDVLTDVGANRLLIYVAAVSILLGSLIAMRKDNLKARLAYSTVSQLGYVVLGATLANAWGVIGGGMHIVMHAFAKVTLFFCAGAIMVAAHETEISRMRGLGRRMPITMFVFLLASLSIIGLPPFGGMWSKWFLALGTLDAGATAALVVLMLSSLLNIAYLLPIPIRAFFSPEDVERPPGRAEAPLPCLIALLISVTGCVVLFFYPDAIYRLLSQLVAT